MKRIFFVAIVVLVGQVIAQEDVAVDADSDANNTESDRILRCVREGETLQ